MKPRLGAVPYLNTRPLVVALECNPAPFVLSYSVPSRCARELAAGTIDVGLIPAIEYARSARPYWIVPNIAIGSQGQVLTVRLFCRRPIFKIKRIALDTSSRTSVALLSIFLREKFSLTPQWIEAPPHLDAMLAVADAALLIGDSVFPHLDGPWPSLDLGEEWTIMTGLPFVFAFWAGYPQALTPAQVQRLQRAKDEGLRHASSMARAFCQQRGGSLHLYERYLTHHIRFDLDEAAQAGLQLFYQLAHCHGLIDAVPPLRFYPAV